MTQNIVAERVMAELRNATFRKSVSMLYRKKQGRIESHLASGSGRMLVIDGARQVGKSYIIRHVGRKMFPNFIEVNMEKDRLFADARTVEDIMLALIEEGVQGIYLLPHDENAMRMDDMVEGWHPNDLGMAFIADIVGKNIRQIPGK